MACRADEPPAPRQQRIALRLSGLLCESLSDDFIEHVQGQHYNFRHVMFPTSPSPTLRPQTPKIGDGGLAITSISASRVLYSTVIRFWPCLGRIWGKTELMNAHGELRESLQAVAKRSVGLVPACNNEASIRLYLVLPMIGLLGYDSSDPLEVYPNHETDAIDGVVSRADFAILSAGNPVIAFATARSASDLAAKRAALAKYFNAWSSAKLGVVTNGILYEFYVDSASPGQMDDQPFLTLDLETAAQSGVPDEVLEALSYATKGAFDPDMIAEKAHLQVVRKRLRTAFIEEAQSPSAELCRVMLHQIGFANVRKDAIERHYAPLVKTAFEEALVLPVVAKLRGASGDGKGNVNLHVGPKIAAAERELAIFNYIRRRLAFLVKDETAFAAIDRIGFKDYVGKLVVYYDREPKGRIFELIRGSDGYDKFIFPEPFGEIITNTIANIDEPLKATFVARVRELDNGVLAAQRQLRLA